MLRQGSLDAITSGKLTRDQAYLVVCMHHYPRFLKKEQRDEYQHELAPDDALLKDFLAMKRKLGDHNAAFRLVKYEERFRLTPAALSELARLGRLAASRDVYLLCQCGPGERCHRDLLLLVAARRFKTAAEKPRLPYPAFEKRIPSL